MEQNSSNNAVVPEEEQKVEDEPKADPPHKSKPRVRRKLRPTNFPKRPLSAYNIFFKDRRPAIIEEMEKEVGKGNADLQLVVKEIGHQWKLLPKEKKTKIEEAAEEDSLRYRKELRVYEEGLSLRSMKAEEERNIESGKANKGKKDKVEKAPSGAVEKGASGQQRKRGWESLKEDDHSSGGDQGLLSLGLAASTPRNELNRMQALQTRLTTVQPTASSSHLADSYFQAGMSSQTDSLTARQREEMQHILLEEIRILDAARERKIQQLVALQAESIQGAGNNSSSSSNYNFHPISNLGMGELGQATSSELELELLRRRHNMLSLSNMPLPRFQFSSANPSERNASLLGSLNWGLPSPSADSLLNQDFQGRARQRF